MNQSNYYEILGVCDTSTTSEVSTAYRKLCRECHPDKNPSNPEASRQRFELAQQAYLVLSDANRRALYDLWRASGLEVPFEVWEKAGRLTHWWIPSKPRPEIESLQSEINPSSKDENDDKQDSHRQSFRNYKI